MKQRGDRKTRNLQLVPLGRPPKFGKTMTQAERQARLRGEREIRREAARDNLRTVVYEINRLRTAIAAGVPIEDLQEACKGIEDAVLGTLSVLKLE